MSGCLFVHLQRGNGYVRLRIFRVAAVDGFGRCSTGVLTAGLQVASRLAGA